MHNSGIWSTRQFSSSLEEQKLEKLARNTVEPADDWSLRAGFGFVFGVLVVVVVFGFFVFK